jgi:hydrophobe/amphiphile efflux-3 (HAE3) family protein
MSSSIGKPVARHPGKVILVILVLTVLFGYYAAQMQMTSDYHSFMPDDEMSKAYNEIQEDYAGVESIQIVQKGSNVLNKSALLEELRLEKEILSDKNVSESLQTPDNPSNSVFSVADMVIYMDMGVRGMNETIKMSKALEAINGSIPAMNSMLYDYLYLYETNSSNKNISHALNTSYDAISSFMKSIGDMGQPSFSMSMSTDDKISYLKNMSGGEIANIMKYGIPVTPEEYSNLQYEFNLSLENITKTIPYVASASYSLSENISGALQTRPVNQNKTISFTFHMASRVFSFMPTALESMGSQISKMPSSPPTALYGRLKVMLSKDFDPDVPRAEASMMIINLNGTQGENESDAEFSDRMEKVHDEIKDKVEGFEGKEEYIVMSMRLMNEDLKGRMNETSTKLLPAAFLLVIIILLIIFRNIVDTVLGLLGLFMAIIWTYGFGVMAGMTFNQISTTVAVLIVGLGIDYAIHTIMRYREEIRAGNDVKKAVIRMETHLGMALILATLTTIVSFLSNLSSPIPPLRDFGIMNAFGIFSAFIINLTFVPAVKVLIDERKERKGRAIVKEHGKTTESGVVILNRILALGAIGAERHPYKVLVVVVILSLAGIYGAMNVGTEFSETDFLPQDSASYQTLTYIMDHFNSSGTEDSFVLIKGNLTSPELLRAMEKTRAAMEDDSYISLSESQDLVSIIKEDSSKYPAFSALISGLDKDGDGLPDSNLTQVYDWLYQHDERTKYILYRDNGEYISTIMRVRGTSTKDSEHAVLYSELNEDIKPLESSGYSAVVTGGSLIVYHINGSLENSQWNSLIVTLIISLIILSIVFYYLRKSLILGTITTLPVLIALIWSLGTMYVVGLKFNMMTVTITSLTIGIGITYSIHLTHRFLEELDKMSPEEAAKISVRHTGSAIFGAAATTMGGFGVLMLSSMPPMRQFGEISTMSILFSFLLSVFILPTFLVLWARHKKDKETKKEKKQK